MAAPREFRQRRFGVRTSFEFRDESFGYGIADVAAERAQLVHYEALNVRSPGQYVIGNQHYIGRFVLVPVLLLLLDWGFLPETRLPSLVPMVVLALPA